MNYIAITGTLFGLGQVKEKPQFPANLVGDFGGGSTYLVIGVLAALLEARISGKGQIVDAAIVDGTSHLNAMSAGFLAAGNLLEERAANLLDGGMKDRPGHVSVPRLVTAFAAVKTRCRAPLNSVSIHELASSAPVLDPCGHRGGYECVTTHVRGETQPFGRRPQRTGPSRGRPACRVGHWRWN